jgi:predicted dehydrogenase
VTAPKVVVVGTSGYAVTHLRGARALHDSGEIVLAGACDIRTPAPDATDILPKRALFMHDFKDLLTALKPDIAVVATPPHTHLNLALTAVAAGCHVLLEKPPVPDLAGFERLAAAAERAGVACQVGFQSFGSAAIPALRAAVEMDLLGDVTGVGAAGAWIRRDRYYGRNPWAGRRKLAGESVVDGALTNPFAHAVASAILVAGYANVVPREIEVELYRARAQIEADDTASVRLTFADGHTVVAAATLCADQEMDPYVVVHGSRGTAKWRYRSNILDVNDRQIQTGPPADLLRDLAMHVQRGTPLLAPLSQTRAFTAFVQAVRDAAEPELIPAGWVREVDEGPDRRYVVHDIDRLVEQAAENMVLFSGLGVPWAS